MASLINEQKNHSMDDVIDRLREICCNGEDVLENLTWLVETKKDHGILLMAEEGQQDLQLMLQDLYNITMFLEKQVVPDRRENPINGRIFRHKELGLIYYEGSRILSQPHRWKPDKWEEVVPFSEHKHSFGDLVKHGEWVPVNNKGQDL